MHQDDKQLLSFARNGDGNAQFHLFWQRYEGLRPYILAKLPRRLRGYVEADDILQDTFASAFQNISKFNPEKDGSVDRWLRTIAVRKLIDVVRAQNSQRRGGDAHQVCIEKNDSTMRSLLAVLIDGNRSPSSEVAAVEASHAIRSAMDGLAENHQQVIRLRFFEERPLADVAEAMGASVGAVSMMANRAIQRLRKNVGSMSRFFDS